jgi:hypothetical protein
MNIAARSILTLGFFASVCIPSVTHAQEYFREMATPGRLAPALPPTPEEEEKYNLALGPVRFSVAAGVGVEFNDNIRLSENDRESDIILRPSLSLDSSWQISEMNTLRFSIGASYAKYLNNSEYDSESVLLSPNSVIAFTMQIGEVQLTFRDRFSYQEDPFDLPTVSDRATYRRAENTAGVQADWAVNENIKVTAGYDHYNLWTFDEDFESLDRSMETVYLRPSVAVGPSVTVGLHTSASFINFESREESDARNYMIGPFVEVAFTENTRAYLEAGFQKFDFSGSDDNDSDDFEDFDDIDEFDDIDDIGDNGDSNSFYVKAEVVNRMSDVFTQRFGFTKTTEIGFNTSYYDLYHAEYAAEFKLSESFVLNPTVFFEYYETSGDIAEEAKRFGAALGLRYILTPSLTLGVDYRFIIKNSNLPDLDYYQNLVLLSLYYSF